MSDAQFNREQYIEGILKEGVDALLMKKGADELLGTIVESASEKLDIPKPTLRKAINLQYDKTYDPDKYEKDRDQHEAVYALLEGGTPDEG